MYPTTFLRLVCSGTLYGSAETFSFSLALAKNFDPGATTPEEVPQGVIDACTTFFAAPGIINGAARLNMIKLNLIGVNGRYESDSETVLAELIPGVAGTGGSGNAPQIALAVTLRTAKTRGRAHAGRFYLPAGQTVGSDGQISQQQVDNVVAAATAFLEDLATALPGWRPYVMSNIGEGTRNQVTHVSVGRTLDTIRSRRRSIPENYVDGPPLAFT